MSRTRFFAAILFVLGSVLLGSSCLVVEQTTEAPQEKPEKDGVLIHISHGEDEARRVLTGLKMAEMMAESKDVLVYFDIEGVEIVLKDSEDLEYNHLSSSKTQIEKLLDKGVYIYVCPDCLKAAGKDPEDVADGVRIAKKEKLFSFTKGRILTLDY
jgi:predicted peroxiredoxin